MNQKLESEPGVSGPRRLVEIPRPHLKEVPLSFGQALLIDDKFILGFTSMQDKMLVGRELTARVRFVSADGSEDNFTNTRDEELRGKFLVLPVYMRIARRGIYVGTDYKISCKPEEKDYGKYKFNIESVSEIHFRHLDSKINYVGLLKRLAAEKRPQI